MLYRDQDAPNQKIHNCQLFYAAPQLAEKSYDFENHLRSKHSLLESEGDVLKMGARQPKIIWGSHYTKGEIVSIAADLITPDQKLILPKHLGPHYPERGEYHQIHS